MDRPVKVKICGMTNLEDALLAARLGAWGLGFIFYKKSPRYIHANSVADIIARIKDVDSFHGLFVGVFVNAGFAEIKSVVEQANVDTVQLHGDEEPTLIEKLKNELGITVIKAFRLASRDDLNLLSAYENADYFLCDAAVKGAFGGTGALSQWDLAIEMGKQKPSLLAGGLNPSNISDAVSKTDLFAYDLSSGVERSPGQKDKKSLEALFDAIN